MIRLTELLPSQIRENKIYDGYIMFVDDKSEYDPGFDPYDVIHHLLKIMRIEGAVAVTSEGGKYFKGTPLLEYSFRIVSNDASRMNKFKDLIDYDLEDVEVMIGEVEKFPPLHAMSMDESYVVEKDSPLYQIDPKTLRDKCKKQNKDFNKTDLHPDCVEDYINGYM